MSEGLYIAEIGKTYDYITVLPLSSVVQDLNQVVKKYKLYHLKTIYGVPRTGTYLASILSLLTSSKLVSNPLEADLVVDDDVYTGKTLLNLLRLKEETKANFKVLAYTCNENFADMVDYTIYDTNEEWLIYPWGFDDWIELPFAASDIDDVLTYREPEKEPSPTDYDQWYKYYFTRKVKVRPRRNYINTVISGRWESDYDVTTKWFNKNNIKVRNIYLVGSDNIIPAIAKAKKLTELGIKLYLESDFKDALSMSKLAPGTVIFALENWQFVYRGKILYNKLKIRV